VRHTLCSLRRQLVAVMLKIHVLLATIGKLKYHRNPQQL
jgi:hypothetical protein